MGSHAAILLFLLLYVPAVILSEAKDPEDLSLPPLSGPFHPKKFQHSVSFSNPPQQPSFRPKPLALFASGRAEKSASLPRLSFAFHLLFNYFSPFSAQESHVKSQNHLTNLQSTPSVRHFGYVHILILDI